MCVERTEGELEVDDILCWTLVKIHRTPCILVEYTQAE